MTSPGPSAATIRQAARREREKTGLPSSVQSAHDAELDEYLACRDDATRFIERHCWLKDESGADIRFEPRAYQRDLIDRPFRRAIQEERGVLWEKSRKMGWTWRTAALALHSLMFLGETGGVTAKDGDLVDDGGNSSTPDSFFGKMRFVWSRLPDHLRHSVDWKMRSAICGASGGFVLGFAAKGSTGRGSHLRWFLWDETAHTDHDEAMWTSISEATKVPMLGSSPFGRLNVFARLRHDPTEPLRVVSIHWKRDPAKDAEWYEREKRRIVLPEAIAQELDLSYDRSLTGRIFPEFSRDRHVAPVRAQPRVTTQHTGWDFGIENKTAVVWAQVVGGELQVFDYLEQSQEIADYYAAAYHTKVRAEALNMGRNFGDIAGEGRNSQGTSWIADLARRGVRIKTRPQTVDEGIVILRRRLVQGRGQGGIVFDPRCGRLLGWIEGHRWAPGLAKEKPLEDDTKHGCDALRYLAVGLFGEPRVRWSVGTRR